jgi:hypothetical protein
MCRRAHPRAPLRRWYLACGHGVRAHVCLLLFLLALALTPFPVLHSAMAHTSVPCEHRRTMYSMTIDVFTVPSTLWNPPPHRLMWQQKARAASHSRPRRCSVPNQVR